MLTVGLSVLDISRLSMLDTYVCRHSSQLFIVESSGYIDRDIRSI